MHATDQRIAFDEEAAEDMSLSQADQDRELAWDELPRLYRARLVLECGRTLKAMCATCGGPQGRRCVCERDE